MRTQATFEVLTMHKGPVRVAGPVRVEVLTYTQGDSKS